MPSQLLKAGTNGVVKTKNKKKAPSASQGGRTHGQGAQKRFSKQQQGSNPHPTQAAAPRQLSTASAPALPPPPGTGAARAQAAAAVSAAHAMMQATAATAPPALQPPPLPPPPPHGMVPPGASQVAGAAVAAATPLLMPHMQKWSLDQLEAHVEVLRSSSTPIPQPVAVLLAEARRREEKRFAKRIANRKSASTSRARKKALVEEMTRTNARLRRQALILALLPDLVVAITVDGVITFCSAQVERVLRHKISGSSGLVGARLSDILVPQSRDALQRLIGELIAAEKAVSGSAVNGAVEAGAVLEADGAMAEMEGVGPKAGAVGGAAAVVAAPPPAVVVGGGGSSGLSSCAAVISSEQSFPLSVVKVKSHHNTTNGEDVSDSSANNNGGGGGNGSAKTTSSVTNHSLSRSTTNLSFGNQGSSCEEEDPPEKPSGAASEAAAAVAPKEGKSGKAESVRSDRAVATVTAPHRHSTGGSGGVSNPGSKPSSAPAGVARSPPASASVAVTATQNTNPSSGDDSSSSSNLRKASEALNRNVRWHNEKMLGKIKGQGCPVHTDDVTGASVTANNAEAKLSSLQHHPSRRMTVVGDEAQAGDRVLGTPPSSGGMSSLSSSGGRTGGGNVSASMPAPTASLRGVGSGAGAGMLPASMVKKASSVAAAAMPTSTKKVPGRSSSTLTFETLEEQSSSSTDSLLSGVEEKRTMIKVGVGGRASARAMAGAGGGARSRNGEMSSEDSGYRESGESDPSREDTSSSDGESASNSRDAGMRPRPLAPTCNICLIRDDLSTIWCEVTSSIRTKSLDYEVGDSVAPSSSSGHGSGGAKEGSSSGTNEDGTTVQQQPPPAEANSVMELLLCLRPIRDGEEKVGEKLRFIPTSRRGKKKEEEDQGVHDLAAAASAPSDRVPTGDDAHIEPSLKAPGDCSSSNHASSFGTSSEDTKARGPMKKRPLPKSDSNSSDRTTRAVSSSNGSSQAIGVDAAQEAHPNKKARVSREALSPQQATDTEKSVVESLMLMSNHTQ